MGCQAEDLRYFFVRQIGPFDVIVNGEKGLSGKVIVDDGEDETKSGPLTLSRGFAPNSASTTNNINIMINIYHYLQVRQRQRQQQQLYHRHMQQRQR